jgi:hypothetical protein
MNASPLKCSVTELVSHHTPRPTSPSFRALGPRLARKRFAAARWMPHYFNEIWPIHGPGYPFDHSFPLVVRRVVTAAVVRSNSVNDLLSVLRLPKKYVQDLVALLDGLNWQHKLLPTLASVAKYQSTFDGMEDLLEEIRATRNRSFLNMLDAFARPRQKGMPEEAIIRPEA